MNVPGVALLLFPVAAWMSVALRAGGRTTNRAREAWRAFGVGTLSFLAALAVQALCLAGKKTTDLGLIPGILTALVVIGPSEEFCKAALVRWALQPAAGFASEGAATMIGLAVSTGEPFLEHFFLFLAPGTPIPVLLDKAILGVSLNTLCSVFWSRRMRLVGQPQSSRWVRFTLLAGLVHGVYDAGSFLPAWTGCPLVVAYAAQTAIVLALAALGIRAWPRAEGRGDHRSRSSSASER